MRYWYNPYMTELLYLSDFDVETCEATVVSCVMLDNERYEIILDQTCFYPRGGGQDWDTGIIAGKNFVFRVEEVRLDQEGAVHHIGRVESGTTANGETVICTIDHERRRINTRLHSAGHVIDMAADQLGLDWVATKGQHYPKLSAVEYSGAWDEARAEELKLAIEKIVNEIIQADSHSKIVFMPIEEMHRVCRHVAENIPTNKPARVVIYDDDFGVPCGGTHVKRLGEIGTVSVPKLKSKKGVIRVNYAVEGIN